MRRDQSLINMCESIKKREEQQFAISSLRKFWITAFTFSQFEEMKEPKTKSVSDFLKSRTLEGKRVLFLGDRLHVGAKEEKETASPMQKFETLIKSIRNIPEIDFMLVPNVSGYDIIASRELVLMESALDQLKVILGGQQ